MKLALVLYQDADLTELDTIELRYQGLLNENSMIGEDFRSQARENRFVCEGLEERIDDLKA